MPKNILILSTSLRKDSNSDALAAAFARGAAEAGHHAVMCSLRGKALRLLCGLSVLPENEALCDPRRRARPSCSR